MNTPLQPRQNFTPSQRQDSDRQHLRRSERFNEQDTPFVLDSPSSGLTANDQSEQLLRTALQPKRTLWRTLIKIAVLILAISVVGEAVTTLIEAWQTQSWVTLGACIASLLIVIAGAGSLLTEWRRLYRLRYCQQERDLASQMMSSDSMGNARAFCERLAMQSAIDPRQPEYIAFQQALHETQNDREVLTLYARQVQPLNDKRAREEISRCAAEATLLIAVSPMAIVDMAFIAWRNIRLVNRIALIYGFELGYYSRIRLFRLVLINMAFAGATEMVQEIGIDSLSQGITARISARAAQGLGAGLLTARLGVKAMELCRPLPWIEDDKPRLGDFRRDLLAQLKRVLGQETSQQTPVTADRRPD
ncbi:MAG: hypothetical protein XXXJIFNMEKO3_01377 [Candidatus Erwinia impunctatus]|nr:hypothetical protein XXXJIFNMEKO_01377 [Culicoides impunctatus]